MPTAAVWFRVVPAGSLQVGFLHVGFLHVGSVPAGPLRAGLASLLTGTFLVGSGFGRVRVAGDVPAGGRLAEALRADPPLARSGVGGAAVAGRRLAGRGRLARVRRGPVPGLAVRLAVGLVVHRGTSCRPVSRNEPVYAGTRSVLSRSTR